MEYDIPDPGFDRIATLDIETTHYDPEKGEIVSIGVGIHDRGEPAEHASYDLFHREEASVDDELNLVQNAIGYLNDLDAEGLVTYNGSGFDIDFLRDRVELNNSQMPRVFLDEDDSHIDLMAPRKQRCRRTDEDWPSLEGCLESYGLPVPSTIWGGSELTNVRFGEELGPAYLRELTNEDAEALKRVIEHYLRTDLEANLAVFYNDIGVPFEPSLLDSVEEF